MSAERSGDRPYGETSVRIVGAGVPDGPLVGRSRMSAERSGDRSLRVNPFRQRRALHAAATSALRCPKNAAHIRLLAFFDRCGNSGFASSATGSAKPQFPRRGRQGRPLRRGGYYPPACRTSTQVCGRFVNRPYGEMQVCIVGAGALDGPLVGHACRDGGRGKPLPYGETSVRIVGAGALDGPLVGHRRMSAERSGDRSLRGNVRPHRRGRRPRQPVCRTSAHVCGRFMNRPYGGTGNSLPHLSQATSSPAGGGTGGGRGKPLPCGFAGAERTDRRPVIANQRRNAGVAIRIL